MRNAGSRGDGSDLRPPATRVHPAPAAVVIFHARDTHGLSRAGVTPAYNLRWFPRHWPRYESCPTLGNVAEGASRSATVRPASPAESVAGQARTLAFASHVRTL